MASALRSCVLTVSDRCARGEAVDASGPAVVDLLRARGWPCERLTVVADDEQEIAAAISGWVQEGIDLILTTGGTGLGPRDRTPEATLRVADRLIPGLPEAIRARTSAISPRSCLSRGIAAIAGRSLVVNLPGSPRGAVESLEAIADLLPHAIDLLNEDRSQTPAHEEGEHR